MKHSKETNSYWNSTFIDNKSAVIGFYEFYPSEYETKRDIVRTFEIGFGIGNNRKQVLDWMFNGRHYIDKQITGTGNIKFLIWAKNQILEFEKFIKNKYTSGNIEIIIGVCDKKRFNAYKHGLKKYGFTRKVNILSKII